MLSKPNEATAESIRALRTHIVAQHLDQGRRSLAFCAPSAGVGCTFIAANLAISLSQIGLKTLLVDGNLRSPGLGKLIQSAQGQSGLAECLTSDDDNYLAHIDVDVLPNLSVILAGMAIADPQTLLAKERFRKVMDVCLRDFDVTIVDTPPANTFADARLIGTVVGYSVVVSRRDFDSLEGKQKVNRADLRTS
jgi:capsular exopolysaccharide synthesis family protein